MPIDRDYLLSRCTMALSNSPPARTVNPWWKVEAVAPGYSGWSEQLSPNVLAGSKLAQQRGSGIGDHSNLRLQAADQRHS